MQTRLPLVSSQVLVPLVVGGAAWVIWTTLLALRPPRASGRGRRGTNVTTVLVVLVHRRHVHIPSRTARVVPVTLGQLHLPTRPCTTLLLGHHTIHPICLLTAIPTIHNIILHTLLLLHRHTVLSSSLLSGMALILQIIRNLHHTLQIQQVHLILRSIPHLRHHHHLPL